MKQQESKLKKIIEDIQKPQKEELVIKEEKIPIPNSSIVSNKTLPIKQPLSQIGIRRKIFDDQNPTNQSLNSPDYSKRNQSKIEAPFFEQPKIVEKDDFEEQQQLYSIPYEDPFQQYNQVVITPVQVELYNSDQKEKSNKQSPQEQKLTQTFDSEIPEDFSEGPKINDLMSKYSKKSHIRRQETEPSRNKWKSYIDQNNSFSILSMMSQIQDNQHEKLKSQNEKPLVQYESFKNLENQDEQIKHQEFQVQLEQQDQNNLVLEQQKEQIIITEQHSSTEVLEMEKQTQTGTPVKNNDLKRIPLFEEFLIISAEKKEVENTHFKNQHFMVKPEILFQYPANQESEFKSQLNLLPQLIFPYGVRAKVEEKTNSLSNLTQFIVLIFMGNSPNDRQHGFHVIVLKSEQSFHHIQQKQQSLGEPHSITELVDEGNQQSQLYCICINVTDFYDNPTDEKLKKQNQKYRFKKYYYSLDKTYCFITRVPIINFFVDCLKIITDTLKYKKAEVYSRICQEESFEIIDNLFYQSLKPEMFLFLKQLYQVDQLEDCLKIQFLESCFQKDNIILNDLEYLEVQWGLGYILFRLNLSHYITLLMLLLMEQNICIISSNRTLLSSLMLILPHLVKPFQFIHPILYAINENLLPILNSPVPFICGIYIEPYFQLQGLGFSSKDDFINSYEEIVFFEPDKLKFHNLMFPITQAPIFSKFQEALIQPYEQIQICIQNYDFQQEYFFENTSQTFKICLNVLYVTKQFLQNYIIDTLPKNLPMINQFFQKRQQICVSYNHSQEISIQIKSWSYSSIPKFSYIFQNSIINCEQDFN